MVNPYKLSNDKLGMADSCFAPCLLTGVSILILFLVAHIFLYFTLLDLSRKRYRKP